MDYIHSRLVQNGLNFRDFPGQNFRDFPGQVVKPRPLGCTPKSFRKILPNINSSRGVLEKRVLLILTALREPLSLCVFVFQLFPRHHAHFTLISDKGF